MDASTYDLLEYKLNIIPREYNDQAVNYQCNAKAWKSNLTPHPKTTVTYTSCERCRKSTAPDVNAPCET